MERYEVVRVKQQRQWITADNGYTARDIARGIPARQYAIQYAATYNVMPITVKLWRWELEGALGINRVSPGGEGPCLIVKIIEHRIWVEAETPAMAVQVAKAKPLKAWKENRDAFYNHWPVAEGDSVLPCRYCSETHKPLLTTT